MKKKKSSSYRGTSYELFDLTFMRDRTRSWRQKMEAIKVKLRKSITTMKPFAKLLWKTTTSAVALLHYLEKEKHLTRHCSASFCLQDLLIVSQLQYVNIEICLYEIGYDIIDVQNFTITVALTRHLFNNFRHYMKPKMRRENQSQK